MPTTALPQLEVRAVEVRAVEDGARTFTGVAVPWNDPVTIRSWFEDYTEQFARGSVQDSDAAMVFWAHRDPIGRIIEARDTERGWEITGELATGHRGADDAYALLRAGVIDRMSIGFEPIEHTESVDDDGSKTITRTKVRVREVSLVPFPAYDGATVENVRAAGPAPAPSTTREDTPMTDTLERGADTAAAIEQLRSALDEITRRNEDLAERMAGLSTPGGSPSQFRSAGHILRAIAHGDADAVREYNETTTEAREFSGGVLADHVVNKAWLGDLTRIVDVPTGILGFFATGALPAEGMTMEYGVLKADTTKVEKQAAEGDELTFGKVSTEIKSATIETYGGWSSLSLQAVQRASVNVLNHQLTALGVAVRRARAIKFRAHYAAAVAAQAGAKITVADATKFGAWLDALVDGAIRFEDLGLTMDGLIADPVWFKMLGNLTDTAGRPLMVVNGDGANTVGTIQPTALTGDLAGLPVVLNAKQATPGAALANRDAIRSYTSGAASLAADKITTLTQEFSVYQYAADATEIPAAIVPLVAA